MGHNPEMVPADQVPPAIPHHVGYGKNFNPEEGPLTAAPPGGRNDPDTSSTSVGPRRTPSRGEDFIGSRGTAHRVGGRSISDEGRESEGMYKVGDTLK